MSPKKHSPKGAGRGISLKGRPGRPGAQSSRRERQRKGPPGDKLARSPAHLTRRLQDQGKKFYEDLDKL